MTSEIKSVGVIGLGTMGAGIVEVFLKAGIPVVAVDGSTELAERGKGFLVASLDRQVKRGRLDEAGRDALVGQATFTDQLDDLHDVDLVIEAVPERLEIKTSIFTKLDLIVRDDCVLATNTSSLSVTQIAAATRHPERVIGMHFFNPAPVLALVEVITTLFTDDALVETIRSLAVELGKKPVVVGDRAGFVANALLITYLARAIRIYETGHVSREDLDDAARMGIGFPMGPLTLSDLIGLDVVKEVCDVMYEATKEPSSAPPALLQQMVAAGRLGRKTGRGFYDYGSEAEAPADRDAATFATKVAVFTDTDEGRALAATLSEAGIATTLFDSPQEGSLADTELVLWAIAADDADDFDDDADVERRTQENAWRGELLATLAPSVPVAILDPNAYVEIGNELADGAPVVALRLHAATKAGRFAEIVRDPEGSDTAEELVAATLANAGIRSARVRARAGLLVDALLLQHLNDAANMVESGYASVDDIDTAMTAGCGYPQGPFAYIAQLGPEYVAGGLAELYDETRQPAVWPSPWFDDANAAEQLG
ncbi:3-hydroxyacyl-CoA dehydrogenase [Calidifontibacter indicus]|uniref:3-hydroxybutyryl-CoA dehydrogenase n=1 Tax=Calidifontibacter indicus TaxID=419650 RepID=A0A3D9UQP7_9MICO|nr:3-hydroxybutyryl-CoA dehydrogenase [Calidifontibacter indicus]REF31798.1 3-hydroxybutyryl-CoA dehydrogenase [Calidifontibacter indicus]